MVKQNRGLGRGLGELFQRTDGDESEFPDEDRPSSTGQVSQPLADGSYLKHIPIEAIAANPHQPREVFDEDELVELRDSLLEVGILQPVVVREIDGGRFELIMGERRLRAATMAEWQDIPAIVRATEETDLLRDALLENLHRVQLNPLEEAAAYQQLMVDFDCTQEDLAKRIKRSRPQISNTLRLLRLPPVVQRRVAAGVLSAGHARALLSLPTPEQQERMASRIVAEGLSVRAVEELVSVGDDTSAPEKEPRTAKNRVPSPREAETSEYLTDLFDTRVNVAIGKAKGKIVIEFAGEEDLDRLLRIINNEGY